MPCPHHDIKIVQRSNRQSAVAAAAYQSGERLFSEYDQKQKYYSEKRGIVHTEIMLPPHAPPEYADRNTLWNAAEAVEKQWNSQLARRIVLAIPREIPPEQHADLIRDYCREFFVSKGMIADFAIHDKGDGNPHAHILLTMRAMDETGKWLPKSRKVYDLDENGERIRLPSGRYKTHKVDLTGWNDKGNALLWRKAWADLTNDFLERNGSPQRIDHRSNAERGIDEIPTVHMGVAACQMEKKGIATEKGELNRNIQKANRLIREIRAQVGKLKEWIADLFKARETAPEQPPQSPGLANLLMKYLSVQREKSRKYSQSWQRQHAADELKTVAAAVNYLSEHGISTLDELDAALSSVSEQADAIRAGMKTAEQRMKELQKLIEYGRNYQTYTCSQYSKVPVGKLCTTQHRINEDVVLSLVSEMLKAIAEYAKHDRAEFVRVVQEAQSSQQTAEVKKQRTRLATAKQRVSELEVLLCKIYEDNILGKLSDSRYATLDAQYEKEQTELTAEISVLEKAIKSYEKHEKDADRFIALIDKYENFDKLTIAMLNEFIEKILVHERDRKGSIQTTQEVEIYFNFVGRFVPPAFGEVELTPEELEEIRKREERKDRLHQNYLKRKANGKQKEYEERTKAKKKAEIEARKQAIRTEDIARGVFIPVSSLPQLGPRKGA